MVPRRSLAWLSALAVLPAACTSLLGIDAPTDDAGTRLEGGATDAATHADGPAGFDASVVALSLYPSVLTFVGPDAGPMVVSVSNLGTTPTPPLSATLIGHTQDFQLSADTCGAPLAGDASCSVTVAALPTSAGQSSILRVGGDGVFAYAQVGSCVPGPACGIDPNGNCGCVASPADATGTWKWEPNVGSCIKATVCCGSGTPQVFCSCLDPSINDAGVCNTAGGYYEVPSCGLSSFPAAGPGVCGPPGPGPGQGGP